MPELSAQIHGFVSSSHFDPGQPNNYLLVDVGAGSVDASLFHVRKDPGGTVSFAFFTDKVELLGAANLNRYRLTWWQSRLRESERLGTRFPGPNAARVLPLLSELEALKLPTDFRGRYPTKFDQYVKGVTVLFNDEATSPDVEFFEKVVQQVVGKVLYGAWQQQRLSQTDLKDLPFFLCGGGARHPLYDALKPRLQVSPNFTWLRAKPRDLALPSNIIASGMPHSEYDRLSVAYGLSQLHLKVFKRAPTLQPIASTSGQKDWTVSTADKSVC